MNDILNENYYNAFPYGYWNQNGMDYNPWSVQGWVTGMPMGAGAGGVNPYATSWMYDNGSGYLRPVYLTTAQLKQVREKSRILAFWNEFFTSVINIYQNYICGDGFKFKVVGVNDDVNKKLIQKTQELIDLYCEHNEIDNMIDEYVWRLLVEGEACIRHFPQSDGLITTRWVEPDLIMSPADSNNPNNSFGIECTDHDQHDIVGYWICERPDLGNVPTLVAKDEVSYDKINTQSNTKRGLPSSFAVYENLVNSEKVLASMISLSDVRSRVGMIRKVKNAAPEGVNKLVQNSAGAQIQNTGMNPASGGQLNLEALPNGTILTSSANVEYEFPKIELGSQDSEITLNANARIIASHFGISAAHLLQSVKDGSYASHLVQESPSFKTFTRWQKKIGQFFASKRTQPNVSIMWKQIQYAVNKGLLPSNALTDLKITYTAPSLLTRDPLEEAQTSKIWVDMGVKSPQTISAEQGMDHEEQQAQLRNDTSFNTLIASVKAMKDAGISSEGGKKVFKSFYPNVPDDVVNALFEEQENNNDNEKKASPKNNENK